MSSSTSEPNNELLAVRNLRDTLLSYPRLVQLSGWGDLFRLANAEGLKGFVKGTFAEAACIVAPPMLQGLVSGMQAAELWTRVQ